MTYRVVIQPPAKIDIDAAFTYLAERSPKAAERWLAGMEIVVRSLQRMPQRCGLALESAEFAEEIRQLLYGKRRQISHPLRRPREDRSCSARPKRRHATDATGRA